jgi:hypothetical protein
VLIITSGRGCFRDETFPDVLEIVEDTNIGSESMVISGHVILWDHVLKFENGFFSAFSWLFRYRECGN